jgi:hypothetical protein
VTIHTVPDLAEAKRDLQKARTRDGEEKLQALIALRDRATTFEKAACQSFDIPYEVVRGWKELLGELLPSIERLQTARRKR